MRAASRGITNGAIIVALNKHGAARRASSVAAAYLRLAYVRRNAATRSIKPLVARVANARRCGKARRHHALNLIFPLAAL